MDPFWAMHAEHTASSCALLGLGVQWASKGSPESWRASVEQVPRSLLDRALGANSFTAEFSLDPKA
eukprot:6645553-Lingulodinium_polyedra.AAC.1